MTETRFPAGLVQLDQVASIQSPNTFTSVVPGLEAMKRSINNSLHMQPLDWLSDADAAEIAAFAKSQPFAPQ